MKTWVLPFRRRNGFEWRIRSRSRSIGAEKGDHRRDLLGLRKAAERTTGTDRADNFVTRLTSARRLLICEPPVGEPCIRRRRPGRDRVATDPVLRVDVRDEP